MADSASESRSEDSPRTSGGGDAVATSPPPAEPVLRGRDIVCVGFADWDTELATNQHHLMERLAADNRVLFIESLGLRRPTLAGRDLRRMVRRVRRGLSGPRRVVVASAAGTGGAPATLHVLSPLVLPFHSNRAARAANARLLPWLVGRAARSLCLREPILWVYVPQAEVLRDVLAPSLVVYHCVDDIAAHERIDKSSFRAAEERFARGADLVLASAPALVARMRSLGARVAYAPNVADTALFAGALAPGPLDPAVAALPSPRIVFTGAISATKLDLPLLAELARLRPQWSIVLVGPVGVGDPLTDVGPLASVPNVHLLGHRRHEELPAVLRAADAALIPYARNALTDSVFPMKVYEYLAAGLPVVATPLPSLAGVADLAFAADAAATAAELDRLLHADDAEARAQRSARARGHSWEARLAEIGGLVEHASAARPSAPPGERAGQDPSR